MEGNSWHKTMYDEEFAGINIDSPVAHRNAADEVDFILGILNLPGDARILDAPCGTGRHAKLFAKKNYKVTGLDINETCLRLAHENCRGLGVDLYTADMADLSKYRAQYDLTVNLFSSFGYFSSDAENEASLAELVATVRSSGFFVLNLIDKDWLTSVFRPVDWSTKGNKFVMEARKFDAQTSYNEAMVVIMDDATGKAIRNYHRMRIYDSGEIVALLKRVGIDDIIIYGDFNGGRFRKGSSSHPVYVAKIR